MYYKRIADLKPLGKPKSASPNNWTELDPISIPSGGSTQDVLTKSIWFEVAVAKDKNGKPTKDYSKIDRFEDKRINAYELIKTIDHYRNTNNAPSTIDITKELSVTKLNLNSGYVSITNNNIDIDSVKSKSIKTKSATVSTISSTSIIANELDKIKTRGKITHVTGTTINFNELDVDNLIVDEVNAINGTFTEVNVDNVQAGHIESEDTIVDTLVYKNAEVESIECNYDSVVEYFKADADYPVGTLVRFGINDASHPTEKSATWDVTIADTIVNGVVADKDKSGVIMDNSLSGTIILPVVLLGRTKIRITGSVSKFDNLYLSQTNPGFACNTNNGGPCIGVALETNSGTPIECFTKFNLQ